MFHYYLAAKSMGFSSQLPKVMSTTFHNSVQSPFGLFAMDSKLILWLFIANPSIVFISLQAPQRPVYVSIPLSFVCMLRCGKFAGF